MKFVSRTFLLTGLVASYIAFAIEAAVLIDLLGISDPVFDWIAAGAFEANG